MNVNVYEKGSGKWLTFTETNNTIQPAYTSDKTKAYVFDLVSLMMARATFEDFYIYQNTLLAVPLTTNKTLEECDTVKEWIKFQLFGEDNYERK